MSATEPFKTAMWFPVDSLLNVSDAQVNSHFGEKFWEEGLNNISKILT